MKKNRVLLFKILTVICIAVMIFAAYRLWNIYAGYREEKKTHEELLQYKPNSNAGESPLNHALEGIMINNKGVLDLQAKYPDFVGWLTIPNTKIDYPFVWSGDNDYYLHHDIDGNYSQSGTIFMDRRSNVDMSSQNTILHGHNMNNGSMFGSIKSFNNKTFFDENKQGIIYLPYSAFVMEIFAYMVVNPKTEKEIYRTVLTDNYYDYVKNNARYYRDIGIAEQDKIITLSTCNYEFNDARMVIIARIKPLSANITLE